MSYGIPFPFPNRFSDASCVSPVGAKARCPLRRRQARNAKTSRAITPNARPTPIPAPAPVDRPEDELGATVGEELGVIIADADAVGDMVGDEGGA